jgi:hypothetical protein
MIIYKNKGSQMGHTKKIFKKMESSTYLALLRVLLSRYWEGGL